MNAMDIPGIRALKASIFAGQEDMTHGLRFQLGSLIADLKRAGFSDDYVTHSLKSLIEEIERSRQ